MPRSNKPRRNTTERPNPLQHEMYIALAEKLAMACPREMRCVVLIATKHGVHVRGSCCDACNNGLIHHVAEGVPDPRVDEEGPQVH